MNLNLDRAERLTNNVTEQQFFALFDSTGIDNALHYLDSMFNGFLAEGGNDGGYNSSAFFFYVQLRQALIAAAKEYEKRLEQERQEGLRENNNTNKKRLYIYAKNVKP
jgi:hypothetical protein